MKKEDRKTQGRRRKRKDLSCEALKHIATTDNNETPNILRQDLVDRVAQEARSFPPISFSFECSAESLVSVGVQVVKSTHTTHPGEESFSRATGDCNAKQQVRHRYFRLIEF